MRNHLLLITLATVLTAGVFVINRWPSTLHGGDSSFYYMHVVSAFVNQDVGDYDKTITSLQEAAPGTPDPRDDIYGIRLTEKGRRYIKYTLGVPLLETPFFFLGHAYASLSPSYVANGWTKPYLLTVTFSIVFYVLVAFHLLIRMLRRYFDPPVVWITCLSLVIATNLFFHTNYVTMSHGFLFFLHTWLLHATVRFWEKPGVGRAALLGAVVGLIALTRVPEVMAALVPVVFGVYDRKTLQDRFKFIRERWALIIPAAAAFGVVFSLQIAYWYYVSGQLIFNPYQGEGFNFLRPRFWKALFAFDNGWLIYTPIMGLSLIGLFFLRRYAKGWLLPIVAFVLPHMWVHYSYYVYNYFPGMGQRPMVDAYPYLTFGLAAFVAWCYGRRLKWLPIAALVLFGALNLMQTLQMRDGIIWTERHNQAFYVASFAKFSPSFESLLAYRTGKTPPEIGSLIAVDTLVKDPLADQRRYAGQLVEAPNLPGRTALHPTEEFVNLTEVPVPEQTAADQAKITIRGFVDGAHAWPNMDALCQLVTELRDPSGEIQAHRRIPITAFVGNSDGNIWNTGQPNIWQEAFMYVPLPEAVGPGWTLKTYLHNWAKQDLYLVDHSVSLWVECGK